MAYNLRVHSVFVDRSTNMGCVHYSPFPCYEDHLLSQKKSEQETLTRFAN